MTWSIYTAVVNSVLIFRVRCWVLWSPVSLCNNIESILAPSTHWRSWLHTSNSSLCPGLHIHILSPTCHSRSRTELPVSPDMLLLQSPRNTESPLIPLLPTLFTTSSSEKIWWPSLEIYIYMISSYHLCLSNLIICCLDFCSSLLLGLFLLLMY